MIKNIDENNGWIHRPDEEISLSIEFINIPFIYLSTHNGLCTWNNKSGSSSQLVSRTYRFIIADSLFISCINSKAYILPYYGLDK